MATPLTTVILNLAIILKDSSTGTCFIISDWVLENLTKLSHLAYTILLFQ